MLIKKIKAKNFKTYLELDLDLNVEEEKPIILIGGDNGGGKTTLFETICGALYGLKLKTKKQFEDLLNDGALGTVQPVIELEIVFEGQMLNQKQTYILKRTYRLGSDNKPKESVYLNMNGNIFVYGTETPAQKRIRDEQQVSKIIKANLPEELSSYFLFDAMQSSKLLEDGVFAQIIKDNFENVLGFKKYLQLKKASEELLQDKTMERMQVQQEIEEYKKLCEDKANKEKELEGIGTTIDSLFKLEATLKDAYTKAKAGAEDQEHTKTQIKQLDDQIKSISKNAEFYTEKARQFLESFEYDVFISKMSDSMATEVEGILRAKEEFLKASEKQLTLEEVSEVVNSVLDYMKAFSLCSPTVEAQKVIDHVVKSQNDEKVADEFDFLDPKEIEALKTFAATKSVNRFPQIESERKQLDSDIANLSNLKMQKSSLEATLTQGNEMIIKQYEDNEAEIKRLKANEETLKNEIEKLGIKIHGFDIQVQQEPDPKYDTLAKLPEFFESVANALLQQKKTQIETEMCEQLNKYLLSYQNYIGRVELSESLDNFSIKMFHKAGNEISLNHLNAASKQIFIQVLLRVLRNLGDYNPPVMIDTVMGVLSEESRDKLMEEYFPTLSEQTILLCTTSEIRKDSDYKRLEPFVSKSYTLIRNVAEQKSIVENGYFGIELN